MSKKFSAIIPMKGHSLRIPGKNLKTLGGKPLFYWIIKSLSKSKFISQIYVDTDSLSITKSLKKYFPVVQIINRPKNLRGDFVSVNDIIAYDLTQIEGEYFIQTHSTNPLLKTPTIDAALKKFLTSKNYDSLFAVNQYFSRFYDERLKALNHNPKKLVRTQDLKPVYEDNSNFYIFSRQSFEKNRSRIGQKPLTFVIERIESIDIDTFKEFHLAELVLESRLNPKPR